MPIQRNTASSKGLANHSEDQWSNGDLWTCLPGQYNSIENGGEVDTNFTGCSNLCPKGSMLMVQHLGTYPVASAAH